MAADRILVSSRTDVGNRRAVNEDSFIAEDPVFVVADGMGGHARGDRASEETVRVFRELLLASASRDGSQDVAPDRLTTDDVLDAVHAANSAVRSLSDAGQYGSAVAGTTLAGIIRVRTGGNSHWMIVNVGDSRVYSWDGRILAQLSVDHSAVQELIDAGELNEADAASYPYRNVITRALGAADEVSADIWMLPVHGHQTFLVCSDGLSNELNDSQIAQILSDDAGEGHVANSLVDAALSAGGRDNTTVIVIESLGAAPRTEPGDTRDRSYMLEDTRPRG